MRTLTTLVWLLTTALPASANAEQLENEARALVGEFVAALRPQLQSALQQGGPAHAIAVCSDFAPRLADSLSASSGWQVKRVSLQARNPSRATPDSWEREVLQDFDARQRRGEQAATLRVGQSGTSHYRYMQAQGVEAACLICHGETLADEVSQALMEYYPDDDATGYRIGEVRGAISLTRPLETSERVPQN